MVMVFSKYEIAIDMALDYVEREERDLYLCRVRYPSGEEFILKPSLPEGFTCIECIRVPFHHKFKSAVNAVHAAEAFEKRMGKKVIIDRMTFIQNGYKQTSHFALCLT